MHRFLQLFQICFANYGDMASNYRVSIWPFSFGVIMSARIDIPASDDIEFLKKKIKVQAGVIEKLRSGQNSLSQSQTMAETPVHTSQNEELRKIQEELIDVRHRLSEVLVEFETETKLKQQILEKVDELEKQNSTLLDEKSTALESFSKQIEQHQSELNAVSKEKDNLLAIQKELENVMSQFSALQSECQDKTEQISSLSTVQAEWASEKDILKNKVSDLETKASRVTELEAQLRETSVQLEVAKQVSFETESLKTVIDDLKKSRTESETERNETVSALEASLQKAEAALELARNDKTNEVLKANIVSFEEEINHLKQKVTELDSEIASKNDVISSLQLSVDESEKASKSAVEELSALKFELEKQISLHNATSDRLKVAESVIAERDTQIANLEASLAGETEALDKSKRMVQDKNLCLADLESCISALKNEKDILSKNIEKLTADSTSIDVLKKQLQVSETSVIEKASKLEETLKLLAEANSEVTSATDALKKEHLVSLEVLKSKNIALVDENSSKSIALDKSAAELSIAMEKLENALSELQSAREGASKKVAAVEAKLNSNIDVLNKQIDTLTSEFQSADARLKNAEKKNALIEKMKVDLEMSCSTLSSESEVLRKQLVAKNNSSANIIYVLAAIIVSLFAFILFK